MSNDCRLRSECPLAGGQVRRYEQAAGDQMEMFVADTRRMYHERNEALKEVTRAHHAALLQLSMAADLKDDDTGVHIVRIGYLAEALALLAGQDARYAGMLRKAAPMHDVGKIGIPDSILKKPGPLSPEERQVMNRHAAMGADILGRSHIPVFQMAAEVALTHHERFDGSGYPHGLADADIPLSGRITAVVDFFDALTMDHVYRKALPMQQVLEMMLAERGRAFDPDLVDVFVEHAAQINQLRCKITDERPSFDALVDAP